MERTVRSHLQEYLETNKLIHEAQHGFRSSRGTVTQLLLRYDRAMKALEDHNNYDVILLNFAKAFDKVDFGIVLGKLRDLGISGQLGIWIHQFLTSRTQRVIANGELSDPSRVLSGIPQGSVIGCLLFLILINDLPTVVSQQTDTLLYCDDTTAGATIPNLAAAEALQDDLRSIYSWNKSNNMELNNEKIFAIKYGRSQNFKDSYDYLTPDEDGPITTVDNTKELGVIMSADGTFSKHITTVSSKVCQRIGWILRSFTLISVEFMKFMWTVYTQPILHRLCVTIVRAYWPSYHANT
jgi:ribonuclease P/MRP protein subunit RPP40